CLGSLRITGDRAAGIAGNFEADLRLDGCYDSLTTLRCARIAGDIRGSVWFTRGVLGTVSAHGARPWGVDVEAGYRLVSHVPEEPPPPYWDYSGTVSGV